MSSSSTPRIRIQSRLTVTLFFDYPFFLFFVSIPPLSSKCQMSIILSPYVARNVSGRESGTSERPLCEMPTPSKSDLRSPPDTRTIGSCGLIKRNAHARGRDGCELRPRRQLSRVAHAPTYNRPPHAVIISARLVDVSRLIRSTLDERSDQRDAPPDRKASQSIQSGFRARAPLLPSSLARRLNASTPGVQIRRRVVRLCQMDQTFDRRPQGEIECRQGFRARRAVDLAREQSRSFRVARDGTLLARWVSLASDHTLPAP